MHQRESFTRVSGSIGRSGRCQMFCEPIEKGQSNHGVKGIKQRRVRRLLA